MKDVQIMRLEAAIDQARRFITAAEYAARQLRTGKEDAYRSYAHAEAKRQSRSPWSAIRRASSMLTSSHREWG